jgi:ribosomal protein S18 acetylase RimI-like enzyme
MVEIVPMTLEHVNDVVDIHYQSFYGYFLTFLGRDFLSQLYRSIVKDPSGIALVAVFEKRIVGFVAGTDHPADFYRRLLRNRWWRFGIAALPAIIKEPRSISRLLRALSMPKQVTAEQGRGTLMSIAVLPSEQKKGIGKPLVNAFLAEATERNLKQVDLLTDKKNNDDVNAFYVRQGFLCLRSFVTPEGREMNEYIYDLRNTSDNEYSG